jgi:hypothetical protein
LKYIKKIFAAAINVFVELKWSVKLLLAAVVVVCFMGAAIVVTGQTGFCNSCHVMNPYYDSWKTSSHSGVNCLECHLKPGFAGYVKGKINGLAQAIDCMVGRVGTKPNAVVEDLSCLRAECHNTEELEATIIDFNDIKFTHKKHIAEVVDGITISCSTCHSHFEGEEHFNVNTMVCFTCHFLKDSPKGERLVQTSCQNCHEVPNKVIKRGLVTINHSEFVSYEASCEDSCHKKQVEQESKVSDTICLNCHDFGKDYAKATILHEDSKMPAQSESEELHANHTTGEKVECFACHGNIVHTMSPPGSVATMIDCRACHSDTHNVQFGIYTAQYHQEDEQADRVLSPMFLTHVECTGCHIERADQESGALDSYGKVAKAVPRACDKCHEEGTGEQYISFWQKQIKKLHKQVNDMVDGFDRRIKFETDKELILKLNARVTEARAILESVSFDGSWGVHNFKYTEKMLLSAKELINE